ncbi:MAG: hypothetical protein CMI95_02940 [Pelagibacteraceae bacterium]|nr:hypothetical protein [Pelagibacteraceae bacterium]
MKFLFQTFILLIKTILLLINLNLYFQNMKIKLIDSHAHLDKDSSSEYFFNIIKNSIDNNISSILAINTKISEFDKLYNLVKDYKSIWCSIGEHPCNINKNNIPSKKLILSKINDKVIGIGETGIDLYYTKNEINSQFEAFNNHIEASAETGLPLIIHLRNSEQELMNLLQNKNKQKKLNVVMHCFTGSYELLKKCLDNDFYISISGIITFKKSYELQDIVKKIPLNRLLLETDSPFLAPVPKRGKKNEPSYLIYTAEYLSSLLNIDFIELSSKTNDNFYNLFTKAIKYERIIYED